MATTQEEQQQGAQQPQNTAPANTTQTEATPANAPTTPATPQVSLGYDNPQGNLQANLNMIQAVNNGYKAPTAPELMTTASGNNRGPRTEEQSAVHFVDRLMPEFSAAEAATHLANAKKRKRREALFASIGDGISALSNLVGTMNGAPSMFDPTKGMVAAHNDRWERLRQERERNRQVYMNAYLQAQQADDANYHQWWTRESSARQQGFDNNMRLAQEERDRTLAILDMQLKAHQITAQEFATLQAAALDKWRDDIAKYTVEGMKEDVNVKKAQVKYYGRGRSGGGGGRGRSGGGGGGNSTLATHLTE